MLIDQYARLYLSLSGSIEFTVACTEIAELPVPKKRELLRVLDKMASSIRASAKLTSGRQESLAFTPADEITPESLQERCRAATGGGREASVSDRIGFAISIDSKGGHPAIDYHLSIDPGAGLDSLLCTSYVTWFGHRGKHGIETELDDEPQRRAVVERIMPWHRLLIQQKGSIAIELERQRKERERLEASHV